MNVPLIVSRKWIAETVNREVARALETFFADHETFRETDQTLTKRINLLVLHGQRLEDRGQHLEKFGKDLENLYGYAHENVHELRNIIQQLQLTVEHLEVVLKDCGKATGP